MQIFHTSLTADNSAFHCTHVKADSRRNRFLFKVSICLLLITNMSAAADLSELHQSSDNRALSGLNIRLSSKIIRPPSNLVTTTLNIPNVNMAKPIVGPPSKSAILEDDQRHRLVILTAEDNGGLTAYMLDNIDLEPHLQSFHRQMNERGCARDRMTITGGLGCVALCLKNIIESEILP